VKTAYRKKFLKDVAAIPSQTRNGASVGEPLAVFTDKRGRKYEIGIQRDLEIVLWLEVVHKGRRIALGKFVKESPDHLFINDLKVYDRVNMQPQWLRQVAYLFKKELSSTNFQSSGIGTMLLRAMIAEARKRGVRLITAQAEPDDKSRRQDLLKLYKRYGFKLEGGASEQDSFTKIYLELT
jgi:GNAT superfamily N-acetyltransferase